MILGSEKDISQQTKPLDQDLRNHWAWARRWDPRAQQAVDWACAQFTPEIRHRGIARGYYEFLWNTDEILKTIPGGVSGKSVMDIGCGAGVVPLAMAQMGARVVAVDRFDEYETDCDNQMGSVADILERFQRCGITACRADVLRDGIADEPATFDIVCSFAVIEHLHESPAALLASVYRALKPGGYCVITTPNHAWLRTRLRLLLGQTVHFPLDTWWRTPFYGHVREYTMTELRQMLKWSGFEICQSSVGNWVHLASRLSPSQCSQERWTTRFTLNSTEQLLRAASLLVSAPFPSLRYSMLVIGRKPGGRQ